MLSPFAPVPFDYLLARPLTLVAQHLRQSSHSPLLAGNLLSPCLIITESSPQTSYTPPHHASLIPAHGYQFSKSYMLGRHLLCLNCSTKEFFRSTNRSASRELIALFTLVAHLLTLPLIKLPFLFIQRVTPSKRSCP